MKYKHKKSGLIIESEDFNDNHYGARPKHVDITNCEYLPDGKIKEHKWSENVSALVTFEPLSKPVLDFFDKGEVGELFTAMIASDSPPSNRLFKKIRNLLLLFESEESK